MRRVTRNAILAILAVLVLLLALGALPSLLRTGEPTVITATAVEDYEGPTVDATNLSERRFPYTTAALRSGRSDPYYGGPTGLKEAFSHSPYDELDALNQRDRNRTGGDAGAVNGTTAYVRTGDTVYRLELVGGDGTTNGS